MYAKARYLFLALPLCYIGMACGADDFDTSFLYFMEEENGINHQQISQILDMYKSDEQLLDLYINSKHYGKEYFTITQENSSRYTVCIEKERWTNWGVNVGSLGSPSEDCINLEQDKRLKYRLDLAMQKLEIDVPQLYLNNTAHGYIPHQEFDDGMSALRMNYALYGTRNLNSIDDDYQDSLIANFNLGANISSYRLRYNTSLVNRSENKWDSHEFYFYTSLNSIDSEVKVGTAYTKGNLFNSNKIRGVSLYSDKGMLPDSLLGYVPSVTGSADTPSLLTIRQGRYILYQKSLPAGMFEINDYNTVNRNVDLTITLEGRDGTMQKWMVPFNSLPNFERKGNFTYSFDLGFIDDAYKEELVAQYDMSYGFNDMTTLLSGMQISKGYYSIAVGTGVSIDGVGALALIPKSSYVKKYDGTSVYGAGIEVSYKKELSPLDTTVELALEFKDKKYLDLMLSRYMDWRETEHLQQNRVTANLYLNHNLPDDLGRLYLGFSKYDYHDFHGDDRFEIRYSNLYKGVNYSLACNYIDSDNNRGEDKTHFSLNVSIPISMEDNNAYSSIDIERFDDGRSQISASISRDLYKNELSGYGRLTRDSENNSALLAGIRKKSNYFDASAEYLYQDETSNINYSARGGVLMYSSGVLFTPTLGETVAIADFNRTSGVKTTHDLVYSSDSNGILPITYLTPFRRNNIEIDIGSLPVYADVFESLKCVTPSRGAVVNAKFDVKKGHRVLLTLIQENDTPVPFGSKVLLTNDDNQHQYYVGDEGQVYLMGVNHGDRVQAVWGRKDTDSCEATISIAEQGRFEEIIFSEAVCSRGKR